MKRNNKQSFETFHVLEFLDEYGIAYKTSGKNIGAGWIGLESCPFCTGGGYHFAVNARSKTGNCWICGETCNAVGLVIAILDCNSAEAYKNIKQFNSDDMDWMPEADETGQEVVWPDGLINGLSNEAKKYLNGRNFPIKELQQQFKLKSTKYGSTLRVDDRKWNFSSRILIPVYMRRRLQCYLGRDFTGHGEPKYMNSPVVASITSPHQCIYNYDTLTGKVIFVEGTTDVWRMGAKVGAFLGITYTKAQISSLLDRKITEATILFDEGADDRAVKLSKALGSVIDTVKIAWIGSSDPGALSPDEALKIKYQLIGEI
jgi:hypothetical protein